MAEDYSTKMYDAIDHYYHFCPDTLMPMLLLALAKQGKLQVSNRHDEQQTLFCSLDLEEISRYDWVALNPKLRTRVMNALYEGKARICVDGQLDQITSEIYRFFYQYDNITVNEELHYRSGRLPRHSGNRVSEEAHRQYAMLCLAEALISIDSAWLDYTYIHFANYMLETSGLQPPRPRTDVAEVLAVLLRYDGRGLVYNPFAGCGIAAAWLNAGDRMYADGDNNDKLFSVARLLNYGLSGACSHYQQHDSTKWRAGKFDFVLNTYMGYIGKRTAFDFCLRRCLDTPGFSGRYAGMVSPRAIFENPSDEWQEALERDWVETLVLMPFGELAVLINADKERDARGCIGFLDATRPWCRGQRLDDMLESDMYVERFNVSSVKLIGFLRSQIPSPKLRADGCISLKLSDFVERVPRSVFDLNGNEAMLIRVAPDADYDGSAEPNMGIRQQRVTRLYSPVYRLSAPTLIVNGKGLPQPRLVDPAGNTIYFEDGFAFALKNGMEAQWLIDELNKPYVAQQLYPYGIHPMVPEQLTEDAFLNLTLLLRDENEEYRLLREDAMKTCLPAGFQIVDGNCRYTIRRFLGNGSFGYTYLAEMENCSTGRQEIVAMKEFFPRQHLGRDNCWRETDGSVSFSAVKADAFIAAKLLFDREPQFIGRINRLPNHHISQLYTLFASDVTRTSYYTMKYYNGLTLDDLIRSNQIPSRQLLVDKIIYPLCQALHTMHSNGILHLDIKPENVVLDSDGSAVLIDFGVAMQYDAEGHLIGDRTMSSQSCYSAPESASGSLRYFTERPDIYGLSATLYHLLSSRMPIVAHEVHFEERRRLAMEECLQCDEALSKAILDGLSLLADERPRNAKEFLRIIAGPSAADYTF